MSEAIILIGGIPNSGKTTLCKTLKSFLNAAEVEVVEPVKLFKCEKHGDVLFLGRFPEHTRTCGTDTTSDRAIPKLAMFLEVVKRQYKYVVIEGDKFFSKRIVPKLLQSEPNAHAYTLCVTPIIENERRVKRGDTQDPSWVKGRHTKVENVKNAVKLCSDDVRRRFHTETNNTMGQMYKTVEKILGCITSKKDAEAAILGIDKKIHHKDILYSLRPFIYKVFYCDTNQQVEEHKNVDRLLKGPLAKTADQQKFKLFKNGKLHNLERIKIETAVTNEKNWDENSHLKILLIGDGQTFRIEKHLPPVDDDDDLEREVAENMNTLKPVTRKKCLNEEAPKMTKPKSKSCKKKKLAAKARTSTKKMIAKQKELLSPRRSERLKKSAQSITTKDESEEDNITMAKKTQKTLPKGKKKFAKAGKTASKSKKGGAVVKSTNTPKTGKKKGRK
jgi:hypothetical protein